MKPSTALLIVVARNAAVIEHELLQYGWTMGLVPPVIFPVYTNTDAEAALILFGPEVPWTKAGEPPDIPTTMLRAYRRDSERNFAHGVKMLNDEYAIDPKRFRPQP